MTTVPAANHNSLFNFNVESEQDLIALSCAKFGTHHSQSDESESSQ